MDSSQSNTDVSTTSANVGVMASASEFLDENVYKRRLLSQGAEAVSLPFISFSIYLYMYICTYVFMIQSSLRDDMVLIENL